MPLTYLAIPLVVASAFCTIYLILLGGKFNFLAMLLSQQGNAIKAANIDGEMTVGGQWRMSLLCLTTVLWWAYFRAKQLGLQGTTKSIYRAIYLLALAIDTLTCVATVDRTNLMPLFAGISVIYFYCKSRAVVVKLTSMIVTAATSLAGAIVAFSFFSFLRGALAVRLITFALLGYTITSFNRLSALLGGSMHYLYEGRGVYLSSYLLSANRVPLYLGLKDLFGWPTLFQLWQSEFQSTAGAGLNPGFNWPGVFGYLYSDIGWWTLLYLFCAGLLAGHLWSGFTRGKSLAIVLYPWVAFWVLFWLGWNLLLDARVLTILEAGIILSVYDRAFTGGRESRWQSLQGEGVALGAPGHTAHSGKVFDK
jgi:hypothetical protein